MDTEASYDPFPSRPKIMFMGTPEFAVPTLDALINEGYDIDAVVTQPDRPKGRGRRLTPSPIKVLAEESSLKILQSERLDDSFLKALLSLKPELLVVVAFGQIIPGKVLRSVQWGGINVHASLLPRYRVRHQFSGPLLTTIGDRAHHYVYG